MKHQRTWPRGWGKGQIRVELWRIREEWRRICSSKQQNDDCIDGKSCSGGAFKVHGWSVVGMQVGTQWCFLSAH
jgi:hypothetical protein